MKSIGLDVQSNIEGRTDTSGGARRLEHTRKMSMPPGSPNQLSLAMSTSSGLDDSVLNAPLPEMALPAETSSAAAAASVELPTDQAQQLAAQHHADMEVEATTVSAPHVVSDEHQIGHENPVPPEQQAQPVDVVPDPEASGAVLVSTIPDVGMQGATEAPLLTVEPTAERPAKRRRGGRRATNPNMTTEERRRQRVLKNRESAMRSLAKKAAFSQQLTETQQSVMREQEEKQERLRKLVLTAVELCDKLDTAGESELSATLSACVERCNSGLVDASVAAPTTATVTVSTALPPVAQATVSLAPALIPPPNQIHQN